MTDNATQTATWQTIADTTRDRWGGRQRGKHGHYRAYAIPSPTGGYLTAEIILRPRWCSLHIDRWRTTDRNPQLAEPWLEANVWPLVQRACDQRRGGYGVLPSGGPTFAAAHPIDRVDLLPLLISWVDAELTWGVPRDALRDELTGGPARREETSP